MRYGGDCEQVDWRDRYDIVLKERDAALAEAQALRKALGPACTTCRRWKNDKCASVYHYDWESELVMLRRIRELARLFVAARDSEGELDDDAEEHAEAALRAALRKR